MLMLGDNPSKKIATLIITGMGSAHQPESSDDDDVEVDCDAAMKSACKAAIGCIKNDDSEGLADAMTTIVDLCLEKIESAKEYRVNDED